jgi:hypothetical protein
VFLEGPRGGPSMGVLLGVPRRRFTEGGAPVFPRGGSSDGDPPKRSMGGFPEGSPLSRSPAGSAVVGLPGVARVWSLEGDVHGRSSDGVNRGWSPVGGLPSVR